jgi:hypothetical protein
MDQAGPPLPVEEREEDPVEEVEDPMTLQSPTSPEEHPESG